MAVTPTVSLISNYLCMNGAVGKVDEGRGSAMEYTSMVRMADNSENKALAAGVVS